MSGAIALSITLIPPPPSLQTDVGNLDAICQKHSGSVATEELWVDGGFLG